MRERQRREASDDPLRRGPCPPRPCRTARGSRARASRPSRGRSCRRCTSAPRGRRRRARRSATRRPTPAPRTPRSRSTRASGAASRAVSANSGVVITTRASASSTMCRSSGGGSRKIAGVTTAPDAPERVVGDPDLGAVRHQHDDAVARLDAGVAKTLREPARALVQSSRPVPFAFEEERLVVAVPLERLLGEPSEVPLSQRASSARRPCPSARPSSRATRRRGSARAAARGSRPRPSRSRRRRARPTPTA